MTKQVKTLSLTIFIDACGWEVLRNRSFLETDLPYRRKLRSVFGFSSACVPSILSGRWPQDHGQWSFFYYSPKTSPFKPLRLLALLPDVLTSHGRVRNVISRLVQRFYGFTGYFQLYNIPFKYIHLFDYCEKKDIYAKNGLAKGKNIFEVLDDAGVPHHVSNWRLSEEENIAALREDIRTANIRSGFLYLAAMDGLLHMVGKESPKADEKLAWYEQQIRAIKAEAEEHYDEVRLFVCSDHGMATVHSTVDVMSRIEALGLRFGKDYAATYDSTMGRFWFFNDDAKQKIIACLNETEKGRILSHEELCDLGCDFEGQQYGELIFLMDAGVLIVPSHMGLKPIAGMHGYHPDHEDSNAVLLSNVEPPANPQAIPDVFRVMCAEAGVQAPR